MTNEIIHQPESPLTLTRPVLRNIFYTNEARTPNSDIEILGELERAKLGKMIEVLEHTGLNDLILSGEITFGAIKPRTEVSKLGVDTDDEGEEKLLSMVEEPLSVIFSTSLAPTEEQLNEFYPAEVRDRLSAIKEGDNDIWHNFVKHMLSGPTTYFLLHDPNGNAVEKWRKQIGATNPINATPDSIRGRFALETRLNLVHGSSGEMPEERVSNVTMEVDWLRSRLKELRDGSDEKRYFPSEEMLRNIGVIAPEETLILGSTVSKFKRVGGEKFMAVYLLTVQKSDGSIENRYIADKAITSLSPLGLKTKTEIERLKLLEAEGVRIPKIYSYNNGTIYQEFIQGEIAQSLGIKRIMSEDTPTTDRNRLLDELILVVHALDKNGFRLLGSILSELLYDGHDFYFIDGGIDIGESKPSEPNHKSLTDLLKLFRDNPNIVEYISKKYGQLGN